MSAKNVDKKARRATKQIRISSATHRALKFLSAEEKRRISRIADEILDSDVRISQVLKTTKKVDK